MNKNVNVEGGEIAIRNSHGDLAIIPKDKKDWVKQKLSEGCHSCIDKLVETLPVMEDYAQDGSIYPSVRTTKFDDTTENKYQQWRASLPKNLQYEGDYDLRGFYKENPDFNSNDSEQHLTDKWKLPNHPTFSDESVYYKGNENYGGKWKSYDYGDVYTPNNPEVKQQKLEWKKGFYSKDKVVVDGKLYDINTPEYKEIYDKGIGYFDKTGTFISSKEDLPEVTVSSKIQPNTVSSYISEFGKQTPKEEYLQNKSREHEKEFYSAPLWAQQVVGGYNEERKKSDRKRDEEDYNKLQSNFIAEKLLNRNKQKDNETRVQWLQRFSDKELEVIKNSDYKSKIEPSIWSKFEQGLLSIGNAGSPVTFKNENLTKEEAKQEDNPLNILQPLSIPTKMVQSAYKDNYSFTDALKGKQNNAGIVEDIVTDPLNLVGAGLVGKLSKADKVIDAIKAGSKVLNKTDDIIKNLPKLKQTPLDFKIEDVLKNISSTERKNIEIIKKGNAYFKELDNPESLKRLKEFGDEYGIDLLDAYKKAEKRWDYGNNIRKNDRFQVAGEEIFKDDVESALGLSTVTDDYFKMKMLKSKSKTLIPENKSEIDKYSINYVNKKASLEDYNTIVWHELSHDINKNIIGQSTKLQRELSDIFVKNIDEVDKTKIESAFKSQKFDTYEKGLVKSKKEKMSIDDIAKDELAYVSKPTETWAFLSTNLRQDLKNTGIIKNYNEILTPEKLEQAIKNGNTVFSRFEPYIKDKEAFIKLFNKMTLSIAPAALYLQSQNQNKTEQ